MGGREGVYVERRTTYLLVVVLLHCLIECERRHRTVESRS